VQEELIITVAKETMIVVITLAAPMLLSGLVVGLTVSILQSITSIQEQSLSMISKMIAVLAALLLLLPWLLRIMKAFTVPLYRNLQQFIA